MKNKNYFTRLNESPNTIIHNIFHIGLQNNSIPFIQFISTLDAFDLKTLLPKMSLKKIQKSIEQNKAIKLLTDNGIYGFLAEVSHPHEKGEHCSLVYDNDYDLLIDKIFKLSEDFIISDQDETDL